MSTTVDKVECSDAANLHTLLTNNLIQIKDIEAEMAKTQKNKATSYHLGQLKAKLAKLKRELLTPSSSGGGGGGGGCEYSNYRLERESGLRMYSRLRRCKNWCCQCWIHRIPICG